METNIDERLVKWDSILRELVVDVRELNRDLQESIRYVGSAGVVVIALGLTVLFYTTRYASVQDPLFWAILALTTGSNFVVGFFNIHRYLLLKRKYSRLNELEKELEG
ncbi:MAG: hypothetical protein JSV27_03540 [Candidatus Bathyarchaeota archaeon]|nr:MAG: hypothetical protein JSV27_03540 [Candidatus Bathyarchaeota archaeon]